MQSEIILYVLSDDIRIPKGWKLWWSLEQPKSEPFPLKELVARPVFIFHTESCSSLSESASN